jgi:arsenate reductase (glutaredoxin)
VTDVVVYHNPACSNSRGALDLLDDQGIDPEVIEYLREPPDRAALERILDALPDAPSVLVRHDKRFEELGLDPNGYDDREAVIGLLLGHPELMQRPVVFIGDRAQICRPPEKVLELLEETSS